MCGITGFLALGEAPPATPAVLDAMCKAIRHRGPDGQGDWTSGPVGLGMRRLAESTLLILLNKRDYHGAAAQFARWVRSDGQVLDGLVRRRAAEAKLFMPAEVMS